MDIKDAVFVLQLKEEEELQYHQRKHHHRLEDTEIHYFIEGKGIFTDGKSSFSIFPGQLFVTPGGREHKITTGDCSTLSYYAILIEFDSKDSEIIYNLSKSGPIDIGKTQRFLFESIRDKGISNNYNLRLSACHQLLGLLYGLGHSFEKDDMLCIPVEKALRFMQLHLFEKFSLIDLSNYVHLTPNYFDRLFREKTGVSPKKYFTSLQMETSRSMLASSNLSIKEIAAKFDYSSPFHFSKCFKENVGFSPTNYRKTHPQLIGSKQIDSLE